ncbi:hypothetical protein [Paraglaciecola arctica]|uniref:hypothetical protein n=1 Tax=Paraglaciecola arctica TaxID=1128911 RepID=UPI001C067A05|nr:hypothetical protein [Paraglaciecola arctica]MBU3005718.1 hypothetical protein [Paraglaciecola arctica]
MSYINGSFAISPKGNTLFTVGHEHHQAIAEFSIPDLKITENTKSLNLATNIQKFTSILLNKTRINNSQKLNRITGLEVIEGELFVNAVEHYDAPGDNYLTTFIVRDAYNLSKAQVDGFFSLGGKAHSSGWISKLPDKWQDVFKASYLHGYAANYSINSRFSMGPTAFSSYIDNFAGIDVKDGLIPTRPLMDFSIKRPIVEDLYNKSKKNKMWTEVSNAYYGFILPNSNEYLVLGNSGGHDSGIGYKATQTNGNVCGGPCVFDPKDYYNFYWIFNVNDFVSVQNGKKKTYELLPISYGKLQLPFAPKNNTKNIVGADFDEKSQRLYIMLENVDSSQSRFEIAPVMLVYSLQAAG